MTASPYVREPWAGASADTWSEAKYSWKGRYVSWRRGIKELFTCEDILMKANRGYVVVVAWENTSDGRAELHTMQLFQKDLSYVDQFN